jgi:tRNA pseudouridine65 synthase
MQDNPTNETLEVLYQDEFLIVVNKPSGLLVHKSPIDKHETRFALQIVRDQIGQYIYPIHRLDKPTSGVLVFALNQEVAQSFAAMFSDGTIEKTYLAICRGYTPQSGLIDHPLTQMLDTKKQKQQKEKHLNKEAKEAQTKFCTLATVSLPYRVDRYANTRYSLVELKPITGRKHQLRRHLKHISHHIVGDTKHGRGEHNKFFRNQFNIHRLLLHAYKISFVHPVLKKEINIKAPMDDDFKRLFKAFEWNIEI